MQILRPNHTLENEDFIQSLSPHMSMTKNDRNSSISSRDERLRAKERILNLTPNHRVSQPIVKPFVPNYAQRIGKIKDSVDNTTPIYSRTKKDSRNNSQQALNRTFEDIPSHNYSNFLKIDDIEGSSSKQLYRGKPKDIMGKYNVIENSRPTRLTKRRRRGIYDGMDYRDVTKVKKSGMDSVESHNFHLNHDYSKNTDNNMSIDNQDAAMESMNENYEDQYRKILTESKRQRKEPLNHPRKMRSYESNANNSAKTVQDYLQKTRKRAEKYVPLRGGHVNSTLPVTTHTSKYDPYSPPEIPPKPTPQFLHKFQKFQNTQKVSKTPAKGSEPLCQKPTSPLGYHENEVERRVVQNRRNLLRDLKDQGISEGQRQMTRNDMKIGGRQGQLRTVENVRQNTELNSRRISLNRNFNNSQRMEDVRNTSSERMAIKKLILLEQNHRSKLSALLRVPSVSKYSQKVQNCKTDLQQNLNLNLKISLQEDFVQGRNWLARQTS
ncbi:unnamed protein product [Moneuplotes crassus]|uniref:Uncharacterized protein n=1 Tax=Euplotes crassus TaxID=5936 RepID=A0AAD1X906_EUPCR|nr:unnamed protein product [Moneuplotes crassus]